MERERRTEGNLELFCRALSECKAELLADVANDRLIELVTSKLDRLARHDAAERDHCYLGGPPTDVHDHVARRLVNREPCSDGRRHGLLDDVGLASAGILCGLHDCSLLDASDSRRDTDDHPWLREATLVHPVNEVAQHLLADLEVGNHAVFERSNGLDVARRPTDHPLGFGTHGEGTSILDVHRHHRWLVQDDAPAAHVDERVGRTEVNGHVPPKEEEMVVTHEKSVSSRERLAADGIGPETLGLVLRLRDRAAPHKAR